MFDYQARLHNIVDGDTVDMEIDLGFSINYNQRIRLRGIDTAETWFQSKDTEEYQRGVEHLEFACEWFKEAETQYDPTVHNDRYIPANQSHKVVDPEGNWPLVLRTVKWETGEFERYLGEIFAKHSGEKYTEAIIAEFPDHDIEVDYDG